MRIVIIGGGGFIGTNLARFLVKQGCNVLSVGRSWLDIEEIPNLTKITTEINDATIFDIINDANVVIHLTHGTTPNTSMKNLGQDLIGTVLPSISLMEACVSSNAHLIYLSSGGAIYGVTSQVPISEDSELLPISGYGITKLVIEKYLHFFSYHNGLKYTILRVANPYGPWQLGNHGQGVIGTWLRQVIEYKPIKIWGNGEIIRDYIYIDDVLTAIWAAIHYEGESDFFNIGAGRGYSLNEIFAFTKKEVDRDIDYEYIAAQPADVPVSILDITKAYNLLHWKPVVPLSTGIFNLYKWLTIHLNKKIR